jgi:ribonuclease PH
VHLRRSGDRRADQLREVRIETGVSKYAEGSVQIECGDTRVLATASVERRVPPFRFDSGLGWVTAEYAMLPKSSKTRIAREGAKPRGRTAEIQRLIGRSLRAVTDLNALGPKMVNIDCDVIQADGGTRTAAVTGALLAFWEASHLMKCAGAIPGWPIRERLAAVSVGIVSGVPMLDLCYEEDSLAEVDMNIVMTASGKLIEVQGTAEQEPFSRDHLNELLDLGAEGIQKLLEIQEIELKGYAPPS